MSKAPPTMVTRPSVLLVSLLKNVTTVLLTALKVLDLKAGHDATHAFAVEDVGGSILGHGDLMVLSLHASMPLNTFEGCAIIRHSESIRQRVDALRNCGFSDELWLMGIGGNGKISEFNAAAGLTQLAHIDLALARRAEVASHYRETLAGIAGIRLSIYLGLEKKKIIKITRRLTHGFFI